MPVNNAAVAQLVEEVLDSGRTPEEVCADSPHLLAAVRARWELCRQVAGMLDDVLPPPSPAGEPSSDAAARPPTVHVTGGMAPLERLPEVPGYQFEGVLGHGGMGVVYCARDVRLRRRVALKMILSGQYAGRRERARFLREARAVAALRHPHVVQVYDVDEHDGRPYFTMELVDGGSLAARLAGAPLSPGDAAATLEPLADAVHAAHAAGIVHRDLKPANVLLDRDGTPKVADFGLARSTDAGEEPITLSGPGPGTPSYMAPEQVAGGRAAVGPAADVYGLGAVLYEMLTGRPPFRGDSPAETARQVLHDEPAPPSRLNARVPRDLETICLTCLHKAPARRYPSAAALGDDVRRFRRGEPIAARRTGPAERAAKWVRRRPAAAALWAGATLVSLALSGATLWWASERAAAARAVADHLAEAEQCQRSSRWAEANAALDRAEARLDGRPLGELPARLHRARADARLVARLEDIRLHHDDTRVRLNAQGVMENTEDAAYEAAFREAGIIGDGYAAGVNAIAARARASNVNRPVADAIYHWCRCFAWWVPGRRDWLWGVARQADAAPDPAGWRQRVFSAASGPDVAAALEAIAADPAAAGQSPELLMFLGMQLELVRRDSLPLLLRVHQAHPDHYGINLELSRKQQGRNDLPEALRYAQAAVALRPKVASAHVELGRCLAAAGRLDEAAASFRQSLRINAGYAPARYGLAQSLVAMAAHEEAAREFEPVVEGAYATYDAARIEFARCLETAGRLDDAAAQHRHLVVTAQKAIDRHWKQRGPPQPLRDSLADAQGRLRALLLRRGRVAEVLDPWRAEWDALSATADRAWSGYAECCLFVGRDEEYRRACRVLLERAEADAEPRVWEVVGRTCLLLPPAEADLRRATALIDRALAAEGTHGPLRPNFLVAKALADYRGGLHEAALAKAEGGAAGALGPVPLLVAAMSRMRLGQPDEARGALARAALLFDWAPVDVTYADAWMYHVLRREAERLILPDLPAFLDGTHRPRSADERLALTATCQDLDRPGAEARLWADAFAADAALLRTHRATAARAAARAGLGIGADSKDLGDDARAGWRAQARQWAADEIALIEAGQATGDARPAAERLRRLTSALRNSAPLSALPAEERPATKLLLQRIHAAPQLATARPTDAAASR